MKKCNICELEKDESAFYKNGGKVCKSCAYEQNKHRRKNNPEKYKQYMKNGYEKAKEKYKQNSEYREKRKKIAREWRWKYPERSIIKDAKARARKLNLPFLIEEEDIKIPEFCPVLNIPIEKQAKIHSDNSPSIDRIIPQLGYVKNNIIIVSYRANRIKNDNGYGDLIGGRLKKYKCSIEECNKITSFYTKLIEQNIENE